MRKLLIVDDERIIREGLAKSLNWSSIGIGSVETVSNGKKAYDIIKKNKIDIVVSDIVMPEMDGLSLIELCRSEQIPTRFVILSSYDDFHYAQQAIRNDVCEYILKPCDPDELKKVLIKLIQSMDESDRQKNSSEEALHEINDMLPHVRAQLIQELLHKKNTNANLLKMLDFTEFLFRFAFFPLKWDSEKIPNTDTLIQEIEKNFSHTYCYVEKDNLLLITAHTSKQDVSNLALFIQQTAKQFGFEDNIMMLSEPSEIENLYKSYDKAESLSHILSYFQPANLLWMDSIVLQNNPDPAKVNAMISDFSNVIENNQMSDILTVLENIFREFKTEKYCFEAVQKICLRLYIITIHKKENEDNYDANNISLISYAANVESLHDILLQQINQSAISKGSNLISNYSKPIQATIQYVNEHLDNCELSLKLIASTVLYINSDYLGKRFKSECGLKFSNYLLTLRIERAKALLHQTGQSIQQIASEVGFANNYSYFSQIFKKYTGMLPKEYRCIVRK